MRGENENVANVIRYKAHYVVESEWIDENSISNDFDYDSNEGVIVLKDGVTEIGNGAFTDSFDIVSVEIPSTITTIGIGAFAYSVLSSVVIPDSVTEICEGAFNSCDELKSIYIPASVERIGIEAFLNCTKLNSIEVDKSNPGQIRWMRNALTVGSASWVNTPDAEAPFPVLRAYVENKLGRRLKAGIFLPEE